MTGILNFLNAIIVGIQNMIIGVGQGLTSLALFNPIFMRIFVGFPSILSGLVSFVLVFITAVIVINILRDVF